MQIDYSCSDDRVGDRHTTTSVVGMEWQCSKYRYRKKL